MKCSMMKAIAICGALAFAVAGCKYDDEAAAGTGDEAVATDVGTDDGGTSLGTDVATDPGATTAVDTNADSSSLDAAIGNTPFDQDPNYARCTDVDFAPVYFGFDASALPSGEMAKIEAVAAHLQEKPGRVVIIEGNCDERGSNGIQPLAWRPPRHVDPRLPRIDRHCAEPHSDEELRRGEAGRHRA